MSNRKLSILAAIAFLSLLPVVAMASTSRLEGMSLPGDYTSDYTSIYSWPSSITGLGNLVYGELGNQYTAAGPTSGQFRRFYTGDMAMGAVLPNLFDGKYGVWAIHLRQMTPQIGQGDISSQPNIGSGGFDPNQNTNQSFDIGWGVKSGKHSLGITLNRSYNALTDEFPGTTWTFKSDNAANENFNTNGNARRNLMGVGVGVGMEMSPKTTVEGAVLWQSRTYEAGHSGTAAAKYSDNGGSNYLLGARAMWKWQPNVVVMPVVKYYAFDLSNKYTPTGSPTVTTNNTIKGWQVGAAGNWSIGSNDLFVLGVALAGNSLDQQEDLFGAASYANSYTNAPGTYSDTLKVTESLTPQLFMALETQVNSWLTLRMGAVKAAFRTVKIEGHTQSGSRNNDTLKLTDSPFGMSAGAGVKLGSLKFDAILASNFFNDPFGDLLQGSNSNAYVPFTKVSATYNW